MGETEQPKAGPVPLDEPWWERYGPEAPPPPDVPVLAPYEKTHAGFELLVARGCPGAEFFFEDLGDGHVQVCLWDIWHRNTDPADADEVKRRINDMQRALGPLRDEDRYLRLQIACLQRCWWGFPSNVDVVLKGIASGEPGLDSGVSCEPPWATVLWVLRHRRQHPAPDAGRYQTSATGFDVLEEPRQQVARAYMTILTWWTFSADLASLKRALPEHADLAETIYRRLGPPDKRKVLYVGKVHASLGWQAFPGERDFDERKEICERVADAYDAAIQRELGDEEDVVGGMIGPRDLCHHAYFRHIDHQIANIGAGRVVPLPGAGEERRRIHEAVTNYVHVLGSWLARRTTDETASIWPPSGETAGRVYDMLGKATARKRWLVACLWKKLQDNQADHGRGALDDEPERFAIPLDALVAQ